MKIKKVFTRITATVLTLVMAFSVMVAMTVTANGATVASSAVGSQGGSATELFESIAKDGLKEVLGKIGKDNAKAFLSQYGITMFDSFLGDENPDTQKILNSIADLSDKLTLYHEEQKAAMTTLMTTVDEIHHQQVLQPVKDDYTHMHARFKTLLEMESTVKKRVPSDTFEGGVIDKKTYDEYKKLIDEQQLDFSGMKTDLNLMTSYADGSAMNIDHKNMYELLTEADKYTCDAQPFRYSDTVESAPNMNGSYDVMHEMQSEITVDFTAYATYLQMRCQCAVYESDRTPEGIEEAMSDYTDPDDGMLTKLDKDMEAVDAAFQKAMNSYDDVIAATVTYGSGTYNDGMLSDYGERVSFDTCKTAYYDSAAKAWAAASKTAATCGYDQVEVKLNHDWTAGTGAALRGDLPDPCQWRVERVRESWGGYVNKYYLTTPDPAFVYPSYDTARTCDAPAYFADDSTNNIILDVNGHNLKANWSLLNVLNYILFTDKNGADHAHVVDSVGGGTVMGDAVKPNLDFYVTEYRDSNW